MKENPQPFFGRIYLKTANGLIPVRLSRSRETSSWGITPEYDWLQVGGTERPPIFKFVFHSKTEDRIHVRIFGKSDFSAELGISRNGYAGFYRSAEIKDYWKIEHLAADDQGIHCRLRDHQGHQLKVEAPQESGASFPYLNVTQGIEYEYFIERVDMN